MRGFSRIVRAYEEDQESIMSIRVERLSRFILPLFGIFVVLNILDVVTTVIAMRFPTFDELNPVIHPLFAAGAAGFLKALVMKGLPTMTLAYMVFVSDPGRRHPLQIRMVKIGALVALLGADLIYFYIVCINNLPQLVRAFFG